MASTAAPEKVWWFYDKGIDETRLELEGKIDKTISELVFRGCRLESEHDWKNVEPKVQQISTLKLDYTDLEGKVQGLADFLQRFQVQSLSLVNTCLQTEDLQSFYEELKKYKAGEVRLHSINFKFLELETSGCEIIAKIVNLLPNVKELDLTNTYFDDEAIEKFLNTVDDEKVIKRLFLGENDGFTADGMQNIGRLAEKCQVQEMELASCYLTDDLVKELPITLPKNIRSVSLSENPQLSAESVKYLLTECKALRKIDLSGHSLDNEQSNKLLQMFPDREIIGVEKTPDTQHAGDSSEVFKHGASYIEEQKVSGNYNPRSWFKTPPESSLPSSRLILSH